MLLIFKAEIVKNNSLALLLSIIEKMLSYTTVAIEYILQIR